MSNWQKLKGKLTAQGVIKPKHESVVDKPSDMVSEIESKKQKKLQEREHNVATLNSQSLSNVVKSKYIGLDCEMVGLGLNGKESALARCCCVDFDGNIIYDKFVRPQGFVTDFRTQWSGVRRKDLRKGEAIPFSQCQEEVAALIKGRILVGHALKNDLKVLLLSHPRHMIRDTAKYKPYMRSHGHHGKVRPRALKDLTVQFLGQKIQSGEHNPAEDANSAMQLYRLKMVEWENELRESKVRAKQAAVSNQKQKHVTTVATTTTAATATATAATTTTVRTVTNRIMSKGNNVAEEESDVYYESDSDIESDSEPEINHNNNTKKSKPSVNSVVNKSGSNRHKISTDNPIDKDKKRKAGSSGMFGSLDSCATPRSIVEIDNEMAAKKKKK